MGIKQIIEAHPKKKRTPAKDGSKILRIAECFMDTIQGENFTGVPSTFLRLQFCTLNCVWCDTAEVWRQGNKYSILELLSLWEREGLIRRLKEGQHLVLTGGSPLKQQDALIELIETFINRYGFKPYIEIENECTLMPKDEMIEHIYIWNNSPKLENSEMSKKLRYHPEVLKALSKLKNSFFKFVITSEQDWDEIERDFLEPKLIYKKQIVLMPEGVTRDELREHYEFTVNMAVKHNVRMTDRLQVTIWNKTTGV